MLFVCISLILIFDFSTITIDPMFFPRVIAVFFPGTKIYDNNFGEKFFRLLFKINGPG